MTFVKTGRYLADGIGLFFWTAAFFYRHLSLVALSLIPSVLRAIQMWNELHTPFWMEIAVALSRVFLFALILAKMADTNLGAVFRKVIWDSWNRSLTAQMKKNWPHAVIAQIVVFVAVLYWLMSQKGKGIKERGAGGAETANTGNVPV